MAGVYEYISEFGEITFAEKPFCEADNLALCQIIYIPLETVISPDLSAEPVPFIDAANAYFQSQGCKHRRLGLVLSKQASINLMRMAQTRRFSDLKVVGCRSAFQQFPALQFGAATFLLPDGTAVVVFRGTDDSVTGWHEDLDLFLHHGMQSYPLAVQYLKDVAAQFDGDLIVCGHSKGGNIALYASLSVEKPIRDRIRAFYNNDGPGFDNYDLYHGEAYNELLDRYYHLVPHSSMLGMFLAHDYDYTVVENKHHLGPLQHDITFWKIQNGELVTRDEIDTLGRLTDVLLSNLIFRLKEEDFPVLNEVADRFIEASKVDSLMTAIKTLPLVGGRVLGAWIKTPKDTRDHFRAALHGVTATTVKTIKDFRKDTVPKVAAEAKMFVRRAIYN